MKGHYIWIMAGIAVSHIHAHMNTGYSQHTPWSYECIVRIICIQYERVSGLHASLPLRFVQNIGLLQNVLGGKLDLALVGIYNQTSLRSCWWITDCPVSTVISQLTQLKHSGVDTQAFLHIVKPSLCNWFSFMRIQVLTLTVTMLVSLSTQLNTSGTAAAARCRR